jgi:hypothetical protein
MRCIAAIEHLVLSVGCERLTGKRFLQSRQLNAITTQINTILLKVAS